MDYTCRIPLNHEASLGDTHKQSTRSLPTEVVQCLEKGRFLHLATCADNIPHLSLMNYTYLPSCPYSTGSPVIIMTTNPQSKKMSNLLRNPNVSLLVHDWIYHRLPHQHRLSSTSPTRAPDGRASSSARPQNEPPFSLATLLLNLNTSAVSSISATINGVAGIAVCNSEEEAWYRAIHLANNTFDGEEAPPSQQQPLSHMNGPINGVLPHMNGNINGGPPRGQDDDDDDDDDRQQKGQERAAATTMTTTTTQSSRFVPGEAVRVIVVAIKDVRISDYKGTVRDWVLLPPEKGSNGT